MCKGTPTECHSLTCSFYGVIFRRYYKPRYYRPHYYKPRYYGGHYW